MMDELISFAQNKEDIILKALLKDIDKGFYVDIGANHPTKESVTKLFYLMGWRGINIEPLDEMYRLLVADRPDDINLNLGVSDHVDELSIRVYDRADGLSTFAKGMKDNYLKKASYYTDVYKDYKVPVTTLAKLLSKYAGNKKIDFMKIDVEGYEYEVIEGNDWSKFRPTVICIEADHQLKDWHSLLKKYKYTLVFFDGLNEYFVANEDTTVTKDFSYPDIFVAPYVTWDVKKMQNSYSRQLKQEIYKSKQLALLGMNPNDKHSVPSSIKFRGVIKNTFRYLDAQLNDYFNKSDYPKNGKTMSAEKLEALTDKQALQLLNDSMLSATQHSQSFFFSLARGSYLSTRTLAKFAKKQLRS